MPHRAAASLLAPLLAAGLLLLPACDRVEDVPADGPLAPAVENMGSWTWIAQEGAQCRDGSATGFGVRLRDASDDLVIFLQGGGACFSAGTCASNPARFDQDDFAAFALDRGERGLLAPSNADNPVADWNAVFVPYCTGDVHAGSNPGGTPPVGDVGPQQYAGHQNFELYLDALATHFDGDLGRVLLTGESAGGFGSLVNFGAVAEQFGGAQLTLLDDSGPLFYDDAVLPPLLQGTLIDLWDLPESLPAEAEIVTRDSDSLAEIYGYYAEQYPTATLGLVSSLRDQVIRRFFGVLSPISGDAYAAGLRDLDEQAPPAWNTYYIPSSQHTFLGSDRFYQTSVGSVALRDWVGDLLEGNSGDVAPASAAARPATHP